MPRLKDKGFRFQSKVGDELRFTSNVSVTTDGFFHLTIPEELADIIVA